MSKSRIPKKDQERTPYDRTKRGIVMDMHTRAFAPWSVGKIRARLHEAMAMTADRHGISVSAEVDRASELGPCGNHYDVIVTYAIDDNTVEVDAMLKDLNDVLYDILRKPDKGLEGKLLNAKAFLDEPIVHRFDPLDALVIGLVLIAHENADRGGETHSVQS